MTSRVPLINALEAFETGKRPKGGAVDSGIPSLGGEHVTSEGTLKLSPMKYVPSPFYQGMKKGRLQIGDVLVVKDGATTGRIGMVEPSFPFRQSGINEHLFLLRADARYLNAKFLYFYLRSVQGQAEVMSDFRGAAQGGISREIGEKVRVPLPSLDEQGRIVDLLSRAEGIVRLRREAQKKAAEIIPALFLDMFGDPATNPKEWDVRLFEAVGTLDRGRSRHRPRDAAELYGGPYPFIQTGDVANSGGRVKKYMTTYSEEGLRQSRLWPKGTLCITIAANIAKTGVLEFDACFPDSVVGFVPGTSVTTAYVQGWLNFLQPTLEAIAPQAAQKNINLEILRNLPITVPPLEMQQRFQRHCEDVISVSALQSLAITKAETAFEALLARTFSDSPRQERNRRETNVVIL